MNPWRLLVFARAPVPGQAKTRLAPVLGAAGAAQLHAALVRHTLAEAAAARPDGLQLWTDGDDPEGFLADAAETVGASAHVQDGADLGERMAGALAAATHDGTPAIVIGSDCPWLDAQALRQAAGMLASADAVLGPARDGGYVLLGLHRVADSLFRGVDWGSERVLETTRGRLAALRWRWRELPSRDDIDRPGDLQALAGLGGRWRRLAGV